MTRIAIVTDSSTYLPAELVVQHQFHVAPFYVHFGDRAFRDGIVLNAAELMVCEPSPVIASHVGPDTVAVAFYQE